MPELPEVETIRQDLSKSIIDKKIIAVNLLFKKTAKNEAAFFEKFFIGRKFTDISRIGKLLFFKVSKKKEETENKYLLVHLKMTGQLIFVGNRNKVVGGHSLGDFSFLKAVGGELPNKYTRAQFTFENKSNLFFNDLRKFGYLKIVDKEELNRLVSNNYGPEPLSKGLNQEYLFSLTRNKTSNIKSILLNQKNIAGLGNIYVDEALFLSGVRPERKGNTLTKKEAEKLTVAISGIIKKAIKRRGTTFSNYVDSSGKSGNFSKLLKVYGRKGEPCLNCGSPIEKIKLNGRGTHYCKNCQK